MKVLILSPHLDDEILSCSSFLQHAGQSLVKVVYFTSDHPLFPDGKNMKENRLLVEEVGFQVTYFNLPCNGLDQVPQDRLIDMIETEVNLFEPDTVVIPFPSYNQDHRAVYEAALTATRKHDRNHWVKRILLGEQPETFDTMRKVAGFNPTYFRQLDIQFKYGCFNIYRSQQRGHRSLRSVGTIAILRGMQSNMETAEAFEVVRWTE